MANNVTDIGDYERGSLVRLPAREILATHQDCASWAKLARLDRLSIFKFKPACRANIRAGRRAVPASTFADIYAAAEACVAGHGHHDLS